MTSSVKGCSCQACDLHQPTRYAPAMFARLGELADLPLSAAREPSPPLAGLGWHDLQQIVAIAD